MKGEQWRYQTWKNSKVEISIYHYMSIYRVSQKRRPFSKIKNITDLQSDDKEGKIMEISNFSTKANPVIANILL